MTSIEQLAINTLRTLSIDMVERAQSGHPGTPMGMAPTAYTLWMKFLHQNPKNPSWFDRDRFVLSSGHASALLYSLLHLSGFDLSLDDLKCFRKLGRKTPGHPEYRHTPGVEATTGPLGQGIAMSIGMAVAERHLAAVYNREGFPIIDHYTYCLCGDGDLMEGVAYEAASLAGHLQLGRYILLYDSNGTCLDGNVDRAFSENVRARFESFGWQVLNVENGNDIEEIERAMRLAREETTRPSFIEVKTTIAYGAPKKAGKSIAHGAPLGEEETKAAKAFYGWDYKDDFYIPNEVYEHFREIDRKGKEKEEEWHRLFKKYRNRYPALADELARVISGELPFGWNKSLPLYKSGTAVATRTAASDALNALAKNLPELFGGAADLASSTKAYIQNGGEFQAGHYGGRNIRFGVREFAMTAISNGICLHGGIKPFVSTYFVFSDYLRPALRLSALMGLGVIYLFTHDSIAVGQDGPTHQPVEQLAALRAIPRLSVLRPADANETVSAWKAAITEGDHPTALVLSRQDLPVLEGSERLAETGVLKGAYVLSKAKGEPDALLMGSGSEVHLLTEAQKKLSEKGIDVSVISFPSWDRFERQPKEYQNEVLPQNIEIRLAVEMGSPQGWYQYVGLNGDVLGVQDFGTSGNGQEVVAAYGFTVERIVAKVMEMCSKTKI